MASREAYSWLVAGNAAATAGGVKVHIVWTDACNLEVLSVITHLLYSRHKVKGELILRDANEYVQAVVG